jgi:hypothetical protein
MRSLSITLEEVRKSDMESKNEWSVYKENYIHYEETSHWVKDSTLQSPGHFLAFESRVVPWRRRQPSFVVGPLSAKPLSLERSALEKEGKPGRPKISTPVHRRPGTARHFLADLSQSDSHLSA